MKNHTGKTALFGGEYDWRSKDWIASDDRVRGGSSQSYLNCSEATATFTGTLDTKTLGGAGFASQRTVGEDCEWDLSAFDGIELTVDKKLSDQKKYTFIFKDDLLPPDPDTGREQSTISWEFDFVLPPQEKLLGHDYATIFIPWRAFTPTYRGKERKDVEKPNLNSIKRFSIMMRSFFGTQEGEFQLVLKSIAAWKDATTSTDSPSSPQSADFPLADDTSTSGGSSIKQEFRQAGERRRIWLWFLGRCGKI